MDCAFLVADGKVSCLTLEDAQAYRGPGFLWTHLHGRDETDLAFLQRQEDIPPVAAYALVATETRPRCDAIGTAPWSTCAGPAISTRTTATGSSPSACGSMTAASRRSAAAR